MWLKIMPRITATFGMVNMVTPPPCKDHGFMKASFSVAVRPARNAAAALSNRGSSSALVLATGGALDLGIIGVGPAEADVLARGRGEHHGVLRHQRDAGAHLARI